MAGHRFAGRTLLLRALACIVVAVPAKGQDAKSDRTVSCTVYPAIPSGISPPHPEPCWGRKEGDSIVLANEYIAARISVSEGILKAIENRRTGQRFLLTGDQTGLGYTTGDEVPREWMARPGLRRTFTVQIKNDADSCAVELVPREQLDLAITYTLRRDQFWLERRVRAASDRLILKSFAYGRLETPGLVRILELGKFDRPRIVSRTRGGLFAGTGWWFYTVGPDALYENRDMQYAAWQGRFESEPWYVGIFAAEAGEPYPGWLWYRTFLHMRKSAHDKHQSWSYWNAGWGQWGIEIDEPSAVDVVNLAHRLGIRSIAFGSGGSGKGIRGYVESAEKNEVTRSNLALLREKKIGAGFLDSGGLKERWADAVAYRDKLRDLTQSAQAGYRAVHFDFFDTADTFAAHRNVSEYFRTAREKMDFTECHLGMAAYGPQFQREVLLNHPTDLHGYDISRFSSDWATFLGFRHSRAEWQKRYDYMMPECGLYYFLTHYANFGHPRRYTDPEPQQLFYTPHSYCGIGYNFHDTLGFRDVLAAASAFSPYFVFGHLDLRLPARDLDYAARFLRWVRENADILRLGRICYEDSDACVVSKIRQGRGAIYCLNYSPGSRQFILKMQLGESRHATLRQLYPAPGRERTVGAGENVVVEVKGEGAAIFSVNGGLETLPPANPSEFPIDVAGWSRVGASFLGRFQVPDIRSSLARAANPDLPKLVLSLDEVQDSIPDLVDKVRVSPGAALTSVISWLGRGRLPAAFKNAYRMKQETVETWRIAPWAFADRVWLVYRPARAVALGSPFPRASVNAMAVELCPRVDYRGEGAKWSCPVFYADITRECNYGGQNEVALSGIEAPGDCYVTCAADRW